MEYYLNAGNRALVTNPFFYFERRTEMLRVTILYPKQDGCTFDYDYYLNEHIPVAKEKLGAALQKVEVYKGLGAPGGADETYVTHTSLSFASLDDFQQAFAPHGEALMADIPNFTNITPLIQFEEQLMG